MNKRMLHTQIVGAITLVCIMSAHYFCSSPTTYLRKIIMTKTTVHPYLFQELHYPYSLPELPYAYDALEPHFDKETMTIHHQKHHQTYIDNLNKALEGYPAYQPYSLEELLIDLKNLPQELRAIVQNHGGGHYNHSLFWQVLSPELDQKPSIRFMQIIDETFGSFTQFRDEFTKSARTCFGSGWIWLCLNEANKVVIVTTANQDNPLGQNLRPFLGLDVWEHAYYLKYQNRRMDYVEAWWHVLNWTKVEEFYHIALNS